MPYLLLFIGIIIALYTLYRFFTKASVKQIKSLVLAAVIITLCIALFLLAITGRLPAALAALAALIPFIASYFRHTKKQDAPPPSSSNAPMTREEAFEILNLQNDATPEQIKDAYKRLMRKVHPDQEGSEWMAAKLNAAKDILLK